MNTVILKLYDYERLLTDKYIAQEELRDARAKLNKMNDIKAYILNNNLNENDIINHSLGQLTDPNSVFFGMNNLGLLLGFGLEFEEIVEFIKFKYEEAHREEQENDN